MKTSCNIIQDLLPLYCDGACSGESRHLVEEHLTECGECRETYELMQASLPAKAVPAEDGQAAHAAAAAWKKGTHRAARRAYFIVLAVIVAVIAAVCLYHGLRTGKDSVLGLTAQAEKYFGVESAELVLAQKRGDYMAALLRNADGSPFMALYQRDTLFRDRWQAVGGTSSFAPGTMDSWNYGDPKGNAVLIFSGLELPTEAKWYTFTNSGTEYLRPVSSDRVLDLFVIGGADDISGVPVLLDENRQELK